MVYIGLGDISKVGDSQMILGDTLRHSRLPRSGLYGTKLEGLTFSMRSHFPRTGNSMPFGPTAASR